MDETTQPDGWGGDELARQRDLRSLRRVVGEARADLASDYFVQAWTEAGDLEPGANASPLHGPGRARGLDGLVIRSLLRDED